MVGENYSPLFKDFSERASSAHCHSAQLRHVLLLFSPVRRIRPHNSISLLHSQVTAFSTLVKASDPTSSPFENELPRFVWEDAGNLPLFVGYCSNF